MDKEYQKDFNKLPESERGEHLEQLRLLTKALSLCKDPLKDQFLQSFHPKPYKYAANIPGLYEYRLDHGRSRVVAKWGGSWILLVALTVTHDHERLKALLKTHKTSISNHGK